MLSHKVLVNFVSKGLCKKAAKATFSLYRLCLLSSWLLDIECRPFRIWGRDWKYGRRLQFWQWNELHLILLQLCICPLSCPLFKMKGTLIDEKISIRSYACFNFSQGEKLGHEKLPLSILYTTSLCSIVWEGFRERMHNCFFYMLSRKVPRDKGNRSCIMRL